MCRMDSITNHYAAKRTLSTSTSSGNLARSTSARSLHHSTSTAPQPAAKRMKLPSSTSTPFGLSTNAPSIKPKVKPTPRTKSADKRIVSGLLGEGWASAAPAQSISLAASIRSTAGTSSSASCSRLPTPASTLGASITTTGPNKGKMREGLYPNDGKDAQREMEREERKRKLELAKARRKSQVGGAVGGRRRSMTIGRESPAARFLCPIYSLNLPRLCSQASRRQRRLSLDEVDLQEAHHQRCARASFRPFAPALSPHRYQPLHQHLEPFCTRLVHLFSGAEARIWSGPFACAVLEQHRQPVDGQEGAWVEEIRLASQLGQAVELHAEVGCGGLVFAPALYIPSADSTLPSRRPSPPRAHVLSQPPAPRIVHVLAGLDL